MSNDGAAATVTPGWYPDPIGRFELRFHNGSHWTADVASGGDRFVDPLGIEPPQQSAPTANSGAATAAMVLGIVAITIAWLPFLVVFGVIAAVVAIGLGWSALRRARVTGAGRSRAVVGVATGCSALVAAVLGVVLTVITLSVYDDFVNPAAHTAVITGCDRAGSRVTATGELTNLDDGPNDFSVVVSFVRAGTKDTRATARSELVDIGPGETATFEVQRQVDVDTVDCEIADVTGPLPFGITVD